MPESSTMRRDVISAYGATFARIASWVIVSGVVYRYMGKGAFALLAFVRGTIGILNYASVGLAPAMIRLLAEARAPQRAIPVIDELSLDYARPPSEPLDPVRRVYVNGIAWSIMTCGIGLSILALYVRGMHQSRELAKLAVEAEGFAAVFGAGLLLRLLSDAPSAVLQTSGRIVLDNIFIMLSEVVWAALSLTGIMIVNAGDPELSKQVGVPFVFASTALLIARWVAARRELPRDDRSRFKHLDPAILKRLLGFGLLVTAAQMADYLYAPTDFLLISWLLHPIESATYGPAVQIDAGLLMLVSALASVLLPKAALAHTRGNRAQLVRYYLRGTLAGAAILLIASTFIYFVSPLLFHLWFGDSLPATRAILPLVLLNTVIGGSGIVGRSILLGMGKVGPFTIAVLVAGVSNVLLSWLFVAKFHLGLPGIILGTIVAVVGRCVFWMPWYVMRSLRESTITLSEQASVGRPL